MLKNCVLLFFVTLLNEAVCAKPIPVPQTRVDQLNTQLKNQKAKEHEYEKSLKSLEIKRQALTQSSDRLSRALSDTEANLTQLKKIDDEMKLAFEQKKQSISQQLKAFYIFQKNGRLKLFLLQKNMNDLSRLMQYYYTIERYQHGLISNLISQRHALDVHQKEMQEMSQKLSQLKSEEQSLSATLAEEQQKRKKILALLRKDIADNEQKLERAKIQAEQLQDLRTNLQKLPPAFFQEGPFSLARGKLLWPLRKQVRSSLKSPFMIKAPIGDLVYASFAGQVVFADWLRGFGLLMIIDHGEGYMSLYGHNQALYKNVGDTLKKGDIIAKVGDSGGLENSGLYFEVRKNGRPLDLVNWFK